MEIQLQYGLCNRLQTIIGFFTFQNGKPLKALWIPDDECPGTFEECFEKIPNLEIIHEKPIKSLEKFYRFPHEDYLLIYSNYKKNYIRNHRIIRPTHDTRRYIKTLNLQNCIGIHIRRTDFLPHVKKNLPNIVSEIDNDYFTNLINNIIKKDSRQKIYLATDNYETQNMYFKLFPRNIIYRKKIPLDCKEKRHTSITDAAIDLFCLIECKEFYGTKESSFSTFVENYRKNKI
jgi:hypothetical protein